MIEKPGQIDIRNMSLEAADFWSNVVAETSEEDEQYFIDNKIDVVELLHREVESRKTLEAKEKEKQCAKFILSPGHRPE